MKHIHIKMRRCVGILLLLITCNVVSFAQNKQPFSYEDFMEKVSSVQIGYTKEQVETIMGPPYKVAFVQYKDKGLVEQLSYGVAIRLGQWKIVNYSFTFYNSKLIALLETEIPRDSAVAQMDYNNIGYFVKNVLPSILTDEQKE